MAESSRQFQAVPFPTSLPRQERVALFLGNTLMGLEKIAFVRAQIRAITRRQDGALSPEGGSSLYYQNLRSLPEEEFLKRVERLGLVGQALRQNAEPVLRAQGTRLGALQERLAELDERGEQIVDLVLSRDLPTEVLDSLLSTLGPRQDSDQQAASAERREQRDYAGALDMLMTTVPVTDVSTWSPEARAALSERIRQHLGPVAYPGREPGIMLPVTALLTLSGATSRLVNKKRTLSTDDTTLLARLQAYTGQQDPEAVRDVLVETLKHVLTPPAEPPQDTRRELKGTQLEYADRRATLLLRVFEEVAHGGPSVPFTDFTDEIYATAVQHIQYEGTGNNQLALRWIQARTLTRKSFPHGPISAIEKRFAQGSVTKPTTQDTALVTAIIEHVQTTTGQIITPLEALRQFREIFAQWAQLKDGEITAQGVTTAEAIAVAVHQEVEAVVDDLSDVFANLGALAKLDEQ